MPVWNKEKQDVHYLNAYDQIINFIEIIDEKGDAAKGNIHWVTILITHV